jgi:hypothetical protein
MTADPYATWRPWQATDDPDGLPDRLIVPLVELLRARGVVTLQSCSGHRRPSPTEKGCWWVDNGVLWVDAATVDEGTVRALLGAPFERIHRCYWPFDQWEFLWHPTDADAAIAALATLQPGGPTR